MSAVTASVGPGDIGWGAYFQQFDSEAPNLQHEIEDLMAPGSRFDPRDGDVIAEALGTMLLAPLVMGAAMFLVTPNPLSLLFVAMSPVLTAAPTRMNRNAKKVSVGHSISFSSTCRIPWRRSSTVGWCARTRCAWRASDLASR